LEAAVGVDDDVGVVNRAAVIARVAHDRSGEELDGCVVGEGADVGEAAHPADVDFTGVEAGLAFLPGDVVDELRGHVEFLADVDRERAAEELCNVSLTGCET